MGGLRDELSVIEDKKRKYDTVRNSKVEKRSAGSEWTEFLHKWCETTLEIVNRDRTEQVAEGESKKYATDYGRLQKEFEKNQPEAKLKKALQTAEAEKKISTAMFKKVAALEDVIRSAEDGETEWKTKLSAALKTNKELKQRLGAMKEKKRLMRLEIYGLKLARESSNKKLEKEREKLLCHICLAAPRDTFVFPCLHLHFCFNCLENYKETNNTCPTCRTPISGVLRCEISL